MVSLFITVSLAGYGRRQYLQRARRNDLLAFVALMGALSLSLLAETFLRIATSPALKLLGFNFLNTVCIWVSSYALLWFALAYSNNTRWINRWTIGVAVATPITFGVIGTVAPEFLYEVHGLVSHGPVTVLGVTFRRWYTLDRTLKPPFLLLHLYVYVVGLLAGGVLGRYLLRRRGDVELGHAVAIVVGVGAPLVAGASLITGIVPPELSLTGVSYGVTAVAFAVATFRYRLFDVAPVGRQQLVREMPDPVVMLDDDEAVVDCNPAARAIVGAPPDWHGTAAEAFFAPLCEDTRRVVTGEADPRTISIADGETERYFTPDIAPIDNGEGVVQGRLIVLREITAQKQREQELERQNERLDQFASTVSHDLRNPLNVAQGRVTLARAEVDNDHLEAAEDAHERMATLIDDLLTFARSGTAVEETTAVELSTVARTGWQTVETSEATLEIETDRVIRADRDRTRQLLANLFRNAIEHAGPDVTVTVGPVDGGFYVCDDGPGIPEEERADVFDRGYSTSDGGTGFGLAIVDVIADAHGWTVRVVDSADGGARFEITQVAVVSA
ncbi:histidine kinase N-terminal 7TM domain-containing protein [Halobaculum sp. MBLA0147]|uniref:histidine kinase N-terminal 7TM domain-containing protein n=1 Tax=Halobaculum sp. MBLA0147 TaxID=3079934 RepID=UPI0035258425